MHREIFKKGIPGPKVLDLGESQRRAYMIETFVSGINGKKLKNKLFVYHKLGKYTKIIHSIKASGFGGKISNKKRGIFSGSWKKYLNYNIKSLTENDKLIKLKFLNRNQSKQVKKIFQSIKKQKYNFGLNHGDIVIWNTLVESKKVKLLDWGSAQAHIIPHFDFINFLRLRFEERGPTDAEVSEFAKGYGMSKGKFKLLKTELFELTLLISTDTLRWALDKNLNPKKLKSYQRRFKKALNLNQL